jgi:hypothetical protein
MLILFITTAVKTSNPTKGNDVTRIINIASLEGYLLTITVTGPNTTDYQYLYTQKVTIAAISRCCSGRATLEVRSGVVSDES